MAIAVVSGQFASAASIPAASSLASGNIPGSVTSGNLLYVVCNSANGASHNAPTDTLGNTYTQIGSTATNGTIAESISQWYCVSASGGTNQVTANFSASVANLGVFVCEISGQKTSGPLDVSAAQVFQVPSGGADAATSGTATNTSQPALVVGLAVDYQGAIENPGTGFTSIATGWNLGASATQMRAEYKYVTATGSQAATFQDTGLDWHGVVMAVFLEQQALPTFTVDPQSTTVGSGSTATFTALATGSGSITYQWQVDNGGGFANIGGETGTTLTIVTTDSQNGYLYRCVATNAGGSTNSASATLTVGTVRVGLFQPNAFQPSAFQTGYITPAGGGVSGSAAVTNGSDTSAASGTTTVVGTSARTAAGDSSTATGTTTIVGTSARTNANDTATASGAPTVNGTVAVTAGDDVSAASGSVGSAVTGTVAVTTANDTTAASGTTTVTGNSAQTNANDTASAAGTTIIVGTSARTNADDTSAASGSVGGTVTGTASVTNADDTADATGTAGGGPGPTVNWQAGGAGHPTRIRKPKRIDQSIESWVDEIYRELTADPVTASEAGEVVKAFAKGKAAIPAASRVDWQRLSRHADRVDRLIRLWEDARMAELDDEEAFMLGLL